MPRGPKGEKRPADVIGNAAPVCAIEFSESGLVKVKNPKAPAVTREAEEDWGAAKSTT
jgi:hypothetical protein